jgi:hypothetical protein
VFLQRSKSRNRYSPFFLYPFIFTYIHHYYHYIHIHSAHI